MSIKNRAIRLFLFMLSPALGCGDIAGPDLEIAGSEDVVGGVWEDVGGSSWGVDHDVRIMGRPAPSGGVSNTLNVRSYDPSLAMDSAGYPVVAWSDDDPGNRLIVKRWDGIAWRELKGSANGGAASRTPGLSTAPSLALDAWDRPTVAWVEGIPWLYGMYRNRIYLKRWNGEEWEELGGSATGDGVSGAGEEGGQPSLALDSSGRPTVAWTSAQYEICLKYWDGTQWSELGGSATEGGVSRTAGLSLTPSLCLDPAGRPAVAWSEHPRDGQDPIYIRRWDGASWAEIGAGSASGSGISGPARNVISPSLALTSAGNPVVAWCEGYYNLNVYASLWNGVWWEALKGSAERPEVNDPGLTPYAVSLAMGAGDRPVVAWYGPSSLGYEVYVKRWNGSAWVEFWSGSASRGGVSNTEGTSTIPVLQIRNGIACVAWVEAVDNSDARGMEILLRRAREPGVP